MTDLFQNYEFTGNSEAQQFFRQIIPQLKQLMDKLHKKSTRCHSLATAYLATVLEDVYVTDELKEDSKIKLIIFIDTCEFSLNHPFIDAPVENFLTADASGLPALLIHLCVVLGEIQQLITYLLEINYKTINHTSGQTLQQLFIQIGTIMKQLKNHGINVPRLLESNDSQDNIIVVSCLAKCMQGIQVVVMKAHMTLSLTWQRLQKENSALLVDSREMQVEQLLQVLRDVTTAMQFLDQTVTLMQRPINDYKNIENHIKNGINIIQNLVTTVNNQK